MFLVDDIFLFPGRSIFWIFREIHHAVEEEIAGEAEAITAKLGELYRMLETGQMTEEEFDAAERALLDRLEAIEQRNASGEEEEEDQEGFVALENGK